MFLIFAFFASSEYDNLSDRCFNINFKQFHQLLTTPDHDSNLAVSITVIIANSKQTDLLHSNFQNTGGAQSSKVKSPTVRSELTDT